MSGLEILLRRSAISFERQMNNAITKATTTQTISKNWQCVYLKDIKDYRKMLNAILEGKYQKAFNILQSMDTCSREFVPNSIYNKLQRIVEK